MGTTPNTIMPNTIRPNTVMPNQVTPDLTKASAKEPKPLMDSRGTLASWQGQRRLFFGVTPSSSQVEELAKVLQQLAAPLKPVLPVNLHLTLRFLGAVEYAQAQAMCRRLDALTDAAGLSEFSVHLQHVECWTGPKVLCLAGAVEDPALVSLDVLLDQLALEQGLAARQHSLRPHISLARHARSTALLTLEPLQTLKPMVLVAHELRLYHSESTADGVRYHVLASWPLQSKGRQQHNPQVVPADS